MGMGIYMFVRGAALIRATGLTVKFAAGLAKLEGTTGDG
jgi:hypothetical protein